MRLDAHLAEQVGRGVEQMLEQDDVFFVFVRFFWVAGDRAGDEHDFFGALGREAGERAEAEQQSERNPEREKLAATHRRCRECGPSSPGNKNKDSTNAGRNFDTAKLT